jgi:hypothetical protein
MRTAEEVHTDIQIHINAIDLLALELKEIAKHHESKSLG